MAALLTQGEASARAALLDVESYQVLLDLAGDPDSFRSSTEIRFRCRAPGSAAFADLTAPVVDRVILNGESLDPTAVLADGRLRLEGLAESNVLTVDAACPYSGDGRGLCRFSDPADGAAYVAANCFPTSGPSVFCCFDQPDLRADSTLAVSTPAGWDCVANGAVTSRPAAGEPGVWRFATTAALKPYEFSLCAGHYVTASESEYRGASGAIGLTVRCRRTLAGTAGLARAGDLVRDALGCYEQLLGVPVPARKLDIVFAPELGPLAMQLPAVMMVSENLVRRVADTEDDLVALVLAHEAAHLWFGCLVEGRWWDDLWLAEALATYLSYTAGDEVLGLDRPWAEFGMREKAAAYRADSLPGTQPVSSAVTDAADAVTRPPAITYAKGASVIRQLAALIGDDALRAGLRDYLTSCGGATATLADLVACWSLASGQDLAGWADQWLRTPGVNTLRPELALAPDGSIQSLTIVQEPPPRDVAPTPPGSSTAADPLPDHRRLRTHCVAIGMYQRDGGTLRRIHGADAEIAGARAVIPELAGAPAPDALIVNDGDRTFARIRFDDRSFRSLVGCALEVSEPLTEAVCWNAAWDMTTSAELSVRDFTDLMARRISDGRRPPAGVAELIDHAVTGADYYASPAQRPGLRQRTAAAALDAARRATRGSWIQRALCAGFAASAQDDSQLGLLRSWLNGTSLPAGLIVEEALRGQILATLAARGLVTDDDLDALAAADPVGGEAHRATCHALRPDPAAKEAAWTAALDSTQPPRLAEDHAMGIWAPGQEEVLTGYRERYFSEALPAVSPREARTSQRLARLLHPATLADPATIAATTSALERGDVSDPHRLVLLERRAFMQQVRAARESVTNPPVHPGSR